MTTLLKIGMMMSLKRPPAGHNKYYFLKVNTKDYYHAKFQVYIILVLEKIRGESKFTPRPLPGRMIPA